MNAPSAAVMYKAAQDYIRQGQPVFPCHPIGEKAKAPRTKNGWQDATLDLPQVKRWLKARPDSVLGIPTGVIWDVLDVDVKEDRDGRKHLSYLQRLGLLEGCKRVVRTPSKGWHLYFLTNPEGALTNKANPMLGLDVRSKGGYVLAPPSFLADVPYDDTGIETYSGAYVDHGEPVGGNDDPLWWDLIQSTLAPKNKSTNKPIDLLGYERQASLASLKAWLSERVSGERNNALHWAVCRCIDNGLDPHELTEAAALIGLGEEETLLTIESALKRAGVRAEDLDTEAEALFPDA